MSTSVLVTGSGGQLGQSIRRQAHNFPELDITFTDRSSIALDEPDTINAYLSSARFDYCINCAAYTAVDKAEGEFEKALAVNATGAGKLAEACAVKGTRMIHISTDYVFKGDATAPYNEVHVTDPVNLYGLSKLEGEKAIQKVAPSSVIIRTSWLYSEYGQNFVKTMIRLMKERDVLSVVNDQVGSPTYAGDLAATVLNIVKQNPAEGGIYHYSNKGIISWYDFAVAIGRCISTSCKIIPIPTEQYPTPATRPAYSAFDTSKIEKDFAVKIPAWEESLHLCIRNMQLQKG